MTGTPDAVIHEKVTLVSPDLTVLMKITSSASSIKHHIKHIIDLLDTYLEW